MQQSVEDGDRRKDLKGSGDKKDEGGEPAPLIDIGNDGPEDVPFGALLFGGGHIGTNGDRPRANGMRGVRRTTPDAPPVPPREMLTTTEGATYCGFKTPGGLRKAWYQLLVFPTGRRGGRRTLMWEKKELDRFLRGEPLKKSQSAGVLMPPKLTPDEEEP